MASVAIGPNHVCRLVFYNGSLLLQEYSDGLFCGQERLFLALVCFDADLCVQQKWDPRASRLQLHVVPFEVSSRSLALHAKSIFLIAGI